MIAPKISANHERHPIGLMHSVFTDQLIRLGAYIFFKGIQALLFQSAAQVALTSEHMLAPAL